MRLIRLALIGCCGSVVCAASAHVAPQSQVLPLLILDNRPFVEAKVDGKGPFSFILDTGSSSSTVSIGLAEQLKLAATRPCRDRNGELMSNLVYGVRAA